MIRLCLSDTAFCSGCNPCERCRDAVMDRVLPRAMVAGGFNQDPTQARAFLDAYVQGFRALQASIMVSLQQALARAAAAAAAPEPEQQEPHPLNVVPPAPPPQEKETLTELPSEPEPEPEPEPEIPEEILPPPLVEGLTESEDGADEAPITDKVASRKQRRKLRGLPRSLQRS